MMAERVVLKYALHTELVCIKEIIYLQAAGSSTHLHMMQNGQVVSTKQSGNLGKYEEQLPSCFMRIRDNVIINLHYVKRFTTDRSIFLDIPTLPSFVVPKKRWPEVKSRLSGQLVISF